MTERGLRVPVVLAYSSTAMGNSSDDFLNGDYEEVFYEDPGKFSMAYRGLVRGSSYLAMRGLQMLVDIGARLGQRHGGEFFHRRRALSEMSPKEFKKESKRFFSPGNN
jgi:hypothetical protein